MIREPGGLSHTIALDCDGVEFIALIEVTTLSFLNTVPIGH